MTGLHPKKYLAVGLAVLGFALMLAAELLPWLEVTVPNAPRVTITDQDIGPVTDRRLSQLVTWQAPAYYAIVAALLALVAVAMFGRQIARRSVTAAAIGVAAGHAVLLAGLYVTVRDGDDFFGSIRQLRQSEAITTSVGVGFYAAAAGLVVLVGAIVALALADRPRPVPPEVIAESPADLTVSAVVT